MFYTNTYTNKFCKLFNAKKRKKEETNVTNKFVNRKL